MRCLRCESADLVVISAYPEWQVLCRTCGALRYPTNEELMKS